MSRPVDEIVRDLNEIDVRCGALVAELLVTLLVTRHGDAAVTDTRRENTRLRTQKWRKTLIGKQTMPDVTVTRHEASPERHEASPPCDLTSLSNLSVSPSSIQEETKKEVTPVVVERRARATRITADSILSDEDRQFALDNGVQDPTAEWAEFIDYWIAVPGTRGTKLDWPATWRNRVRMVATKHGAKNGNSREIGGFARLSLELARANREQGAGSDSGFEEPAFDLVPRR